MAPPLVVSLSGQGALLFIVACEQAPSSPTSPPPNLQVRGEITVSANSNAGIGSIQAQVDGRNIEVAR